MSVAVIINPISGGAKPDAARRRAELASSVLTAAGTPGEIFVTERKGHARDLAVGAVARGAQLVIAWGGDGTINEVATALAFGQTPLAIVPAGSGNGLARELGIPRRPERALAAALASPPRAIDAGELGGRLFFSIAGIGFDAHVADCFDRDKGGSRGLAGYIRITARELMSYRPSDYTISGDVVQQARRCVLVTLANSGQFGNGARIAPAARVDDGRLDLVIYEETSRFGTILALPRLFTGGAGRIRGVTMRQLERVTIERDTPMTFHVDGEPVRGGTRLEGQIHRAAIRVCVA